MSRVIKKLNDEILKSGLYKKFFAKQTPGDRIAPGKHQPSELRYDAGEELPGGMKNVYLQVNSEAKNTALKKYKAKHGTHSNIATFQINTNTPEDERHDEMERKLKDAERTFKEKVG